MRDLASVKKHIELKRQSDLLQACMNGANSEYADKKKGRETDSYHLRQRAFKEITNTRGLNTSQTHRNSKTIKV